MHSVGHTRYTFGLLQLLVAAVCAFCSLGWCACVSENYNNTSGSKIRVFVGLLLVLLVLKMNV